MSTRGFSWCTCPYCPDNQRRVSYPLRYLSSVPSLHVTHQYGLCEWCNIWQRLMPGYELTSMYQAYGETFEIIHDYFRGGVEYSAARIARMIRHVAEYIDELADMSSSPGRWKELAYALALLADEVLSEYAHDYRYYSRLPGNGPWYRNRPLVGYR